MQLIEKVTLMKAVLIVIVLYLTSSCSADVNSYKNTEVKSAKPFDIKEYFNGDVTAWGIVQDYTNKVTRRFCVELTGSWTNERGILAEKFYFDDGEVSYRNWQLTKQHDGSYLGEAEDVKGVAVGKHQSFAFQFTYQLLLTLDESTYVVDMDDWMYQLDDYRVMNKTTMKKLGVEVAQITLFFDKELPIKECSA